MATAVTMLYPISPSSTSSSTPVTVTVTGSVLPEGRTTDTGTVPSPVLELERGIVTSAVGAGAGVSVNVAVPPASVVGPEMAETVIVGPQLHASPPVTAVGAGSSPRPLIPQLGGGGGVGESSEE